MAKIEMLEGSTSILLVVVLTRAYSAATLTPHRQELTSGYVNDFGGKRIAGTGQIICEGTWTDMYGRKIRTSDGIKRMTYFEGLSDCDLGDVFDQYMAMRIEEYSHYVHKKTGRRFDHIFGSSSLNAVACDIALLREEGLSDHSPLVVIFEPKKKSSGGPEPTNIE